MRNNHFAPTLLKMVLGVTLLSSRGSGQIFLDPQFPPQIRWYQINTEHYQIIFSKEFEQKAQQVANTLEYLYKPLRSTLTSTGNRWPVLLNNLSSLGNGYVTLMPSKSEWYATPSVSSFAGGIEWFNLLSAHEGRHMAQFEAVNRGLNRYAYYLFGDAGLMLFSGIAVPNWFWEGDAVAIETAFTNSGRGRLPDFDKEIRTQVLSGKVFSYQKALLGSYRDFAGDHYQLGYLLVTEGRMKYGEKFWQSAITKSSWRSYNPFAFSSALKSLTGMGISEFYYTSLNSWYKRWQEHKDNLELSECKIINSSVNCYTNYIYPCLRKGENILAIKSGKGDIPSLIEIDNQGQEKFVAYLPTDEWISYNNEIIVWHYYDTHPRWQNIIKTSIEGFDCETREYFTLVESSRYLMPAISPDGKFLVAVEYNEQGKCFLVLFNKAKEFKEKVVLDTGSNFIRYPSWSSDSKKIVYVRQEGNKLALSLYDVERGSRVEIIPLGDENITYPVFFRNYILYASPYSGVDNIYAISLTNGERYQVTSRPFGVSYPAVSENDSLLIFSDYTVNGYRLALQKLDPINWKPIDAIKRIENKVPQILANQEKFKPEDWDKIPSKTYPVQGYSPVKNMINIHSWVILPLDPLLIGGFMSNDILNTTSVTFLTIFNNNEKTMELSAGVGYAGFYPIIKLNTAIGERLERKDFSGIILTDRWREKNISMSLEIPLFYRQRIYSTNLSFGTMLNYSLIEGKNFASSENGAILPITTYFNFSREQMKAERDLQTPKGVDIEVEITHTPIKMEFYGRHFSILGRTYLPGIRKHHSLNLELAAEHQWDGNYQYESNIKFPRGYKFLTTRHFYKGSLNYAYPLFYPDWALGKWYYLKRIHQTLFFDYGLQLDNNLRNHFRSLGTELLFDFHLFTLPIELTAGVQIAYAFEDRKVRTGMVIGGFSVLF